MLLKTPSLKTSQWALQDVCLLGLAQQYWMKIHGPQKKSSGIEPSPWGSIHWVEMVFDRNWRLIMWIMKIIVSCGSTTETSEQTRTGPNRFLHYYSYCYYYCYIWVAAKATSTAELLGVTMSKPALWLLHWFFHTVSRSHNWLKPITFP